MNDYLIKEYSVNYHSELISFFIQNDNLFYDPFSKHVDIEQYVAKLASFGKILLALKGESIIGFVAGYMNDETNHNAYLQVVLVDRLYSGHGVGSKLIKEFVFAAIDYGMSKVFLTVDDDNVRAHGLYKHLGFSDTEDERLEQKRKTRMVNDLFCGKKHISTKDAQNRLLEMAKLIASIFEKNNIEYMLAFGSLLGAIRHKGFIPWDDDFDLFLFDDKYELAISLLRQELPSDMFVEYADTEPLYFHSWAHVKDMDTFCECSQYPQDGIYRHKGLSIDLYRLFPMKMSEVQTFRKNEFLGYLKRKRRIGIINDKDFESQVLKLQREVSALGTKDIDVFGMVLNEAYVESNDVYPLTKYVFEDTSFFGPANYEHILNHFYDDKYLQLPEPKERTPHYDVIFRLF